VGIPRTQIQLTTAEIIGVIRDLRSGRGDEGAIERFETAFTARYSYPRGVAFTKARMAFFHVLTQAGLPPGAGVAISALHVADFVNIIRLAGFRPVVVDLEPGAYWMDAADLARKADGIAAVLVTHLSGYATPMAPIMAVARAHNALVIEDCSQAMSASLDGQPLGTHGDVAIFSLSLLKSICTLNGGIAMTRDQALLDRLRAAAAALPAPDAAPLIKEAVRNLILKTATARPVFSTVVMPGLRALQALGDVFARYQKTNKTVILRSALPPEFLTGYHPALARLGLSQLASFAGREQRRTAMARQLYDAVADNPAFQVPRRAGGDGDAFWLFPLIAKDPDHLKAHLGRAGIDSSRMLLGVMSAEDAFQGLGFQAATAEAVHAATLFVPMYATLRDNELTRLVAALKAYRG
jgi:dTDP-4-amino-4,6-dideoxygalactose transaminase